MKVFFDECVPRPLRKSWIAHDVKTAQEMGWGRLKNGALLAQAEQAGFEVFVSSDQNLKYQQNLQGRRIAILVLPTNYWPTLRENHEKVIAALDSIHPGQYCELSF